MMDVKAELEINLRKPLLKKDLPLVTDVKTAFDRILKNPVVKKELPMIQLGWPYLEMRRDKLVMSFLAHREKLLDHGGLALYAPQFEVAFVYPFEHVASFRNLTLDMQIDVEKPACELSKIQIEKNGEYMMHTQMLYEACTRALQMQAEYRKTSDLTVRKYQELYEQTAEALGLTPVYGRAK